MTPHPSTPGRAARAFLLLLAAGACGPRPGPTGGSGHDPAGDGQPVGTGDVAATPGTDVTPVLGVPLGGTPALVAEALGLPPPEPSAPAAPPGEPPVELELAVAGITGLLEVRFHEGRASDFSFRATGADATETAYRALAARAAEELGPGAATRCESEDGIPFPEYLATGHGRLETEWRGGPRSGQVALQGSFAVDGTLQLRAFFARPDLLPPLEDFARGPGRTPRVAGCAAANRPALPRAAKQTAAACTVDLSGAPPAAVLDLPFGADRAAIEAQLGRPFEEDHGRFSTPFEVAGVPGRLHVQFYAGCLATLMFLAEGEAAAPESYLAVRDWARTTPLGPGDGVRCVSEAGVEERAYIAAGFGLRATNWRDGEPLEGSLWLSRHWSGEPGTQIVFEAAYLPLRPYAPQYDFAGAGPPGRRPGTQGP